MRARLFSAYLFLILISIIITGFISLKFTEQNYLDMVEQRLIDNAKVIRDNLINYDDPEAYNSLAKHYGEELGIRLTIVSPDGTVIGDSLTDISSMDKHNTRPEIESARKGLIGKATRYSDTLGTFMMYVAIPLERDAGVLRLAMPLNEIQSKIRSQWRYIIIALAIALAIAVYQGNRFSRNVTKPILKMIELSNRIAKGEFVKMVEVDMKDEMGQLAQAFNAMASKLNQSMGDLKANNLKLEAILSSIADGVIAVDINLKIILINPTALDLLNVDDNVLGEYFLEVFKHNQLYIMLQQVLHKNKALSMELVLGDENEKIIRINGAPIKGESNALGAVILVQDITELRKLEQIRTDFVANVSHELKTPLTSIKGFVETLQEGAIEDKDTRHKFLDIIDIETDRLSRLINDILSLSELESKKSSILVENINIAAIARETLEIMKTYAETKRISLEYLSAQKDIWIHGSGDRIKQMFINLVDNAIKYTPEGGNVSILLEDLPGKVILRVRDTGIGIAEEHIPRLFERFYRVDKGRSRNLGGTGLGLAIVKHIVLSMKGQIQVQSQVGKGAEFTIYLQKK